MPTTWPAEESPPPPGRFRFDLPYAAFEDTSEDTYFYHHLAWPMATPFSRTLFPGREFTQPINGRFFYPCFESEDGKETLQSWEMAAKILSVKRWQISGTLGDSTVNIQIPAGGDYLREFVLVENPDPELPPSYEERVTDYEPAYGRRHWLPTQFNWSDREGVSSIKTAEVYFTVFFSTPAGDDEEETVEWSEPALSFAGAKDEQVPSLSPHFSLSISASSGDADDGTIYRGSWRSGSIAIPDDLEEAGFVWENFEWKEIPGVKFLGKPVLGYDTEAYLEGGWSTPVVDLNISAAELWTPGEWAAL